MRPLPQPKSSCSTHLRSSGSSGPCSMHWSSRVNPWSNSGVTDTQADIRWSRTVTKGAIWTSYKAQRSSITLHRDRLNRSAMGSQDKVHQTSTRTKLVNKACAKDLWLCTWITNLRRDWCLAWVSTLNWFCPTCCLSKLIPDNWMFDPSMRLLRLKVRRPLKRSGKLRDLGQRVT